jgi:recombinational DNA repair protein RecR
MACCSKREMPGVGKQVREVILSVANVLSFAARTGKVTAERDTVEKRLNLCRDCRHMTDNNRCTLCGCFLHLKTGLQSASCPIKKW